MDMDMACVLLLMFWLSFACRLRIRGELFAVIPAEAGIHLDLAAGGNARNQAGFQLSLD
jgi:hypothetical protein